MYIINLFLGRIIASSHFPNNPVEAIKEAFNRTDESFLEKVRQKIYFPTFLK